MMTAESGDSGEKWRNLRDVYRIPSTRLSNELDDKVTEGEIQNDEVPGLVTQTDTDITD